MVFPFYGGCGRVWLLQSETIPLAQPAYGCRQSTLVQPFHLFHEANIWVPWAFYSLGNFSKGMGVRLRLSLQCLLVCWCI